MHFLHRIEKEISLFTATHFFEQTFLQSIRLNKRNKRVDYDIVDGMFNMKMLTRCREMVWYREKIMYELQRLSAISDVNLDFLDESAREEMNNTFYSPDCFGDTDDYTYDKCMHLYTHFKQLPRPDFWDVFSVFYRIEANDLVTTLDNALYYASILPTLHANYECFVQNYIQLKNFNFYVESNVLSETLKNFGEDFYFDSPYKRFVFFKFCNSCSQNFCHNKN